MPFEIKTLIDVGVMSPASRKNLKLGDVPIDREVFTRKYKNIEQTTAGDSIAENTVTPSSQKQEEPVEITEENKRNSVIYKVALVKYIEACKKWSDDYSDILDKRKEYFDSLWDAERENLQKQIANKRDANAAGLFCGECRPSRAGLAQGVRLPAAWYIRPSVPVCWLITIPL